MEHDNLFRPSVVPPMLVGDNVAVLWAAPRHGHPLRGAALWRGRSHAGSLFSFVLTLLPVISSAAEHQYALREGLGCMTCELSSRQYSSI